MKKLFIFLAVAIFGVLVIADSYYPGTLQVSAIRITNGAPTAGMVLIATNSAGDSFWGTPAAGSGSGSTNLETLASGYLTVGNIFSSNLVTANSLVSSNGFGDSTLSIKAGRLSAADGSARVSFKSYLGGSISEYPAEIIVSPEVAAGGRSSMRFGTSSNGTLSHYAMTLNGSGYLGIGTTNPVVSLDVTGQVNAASAILTNGVTIPSGAGTGKVLTSDTNGVGTWAVPSPDTNNFDATQFTVQNGTNVAISTGAKFTNAVALETNETALTTGWTNNTAAGYNTFTTSGTTISSAIESSAFGIGSAGFPIVSGAVYRATFNLTLNSGVAPFLAFAQDTNAVGIQCIHTTVSGTNRVFFTSTRTGAEAMLLYVAANANFSVSDFMLVKVSPSVAGQTVYAQDGLLVNNQATFRGGISSRANFRTEIYGDSANARTNSESVLVGYGTDTGFENTYAAQAYGGKPTLVGYEAYGGGTAIGYKARATNFEAVAIGPQSYAGGLADIAIGDAARAFGGNGTVIGDVMWKSGNADYLIGGGGAGTASNYIAAFAPVGGGVTYNVDVATAHNQGSLGWYNEAAQPFTNGAGAFNDWWLGGPLQARAPHAITLNITHMRAGNGSDSNGVHFTINGSAGTGTGTGGNIVLRTARPGASGTVTNFLSDTVVVTATNATFPKAIAIGPTPANITNAIAGTAAIDFPSVLAGAQFDAPITVTGCTSNNCHVSLCVPWEAASGGGIFTHYESNDVVYVRFSNNNLTLAIDPGPATFSALVFKVQ